MWENAPRALAASLAITVAWPAETWGRIPLVTGLSALDNLPEGLTLKWPNDLMRVDTKVAGILVEGGDGIVVAGLGINLWWSEPPEGYGGVFDIDPGDDSHLEIAKGWASSMIGRLASSPEEWGRPEYVAACATLGRSVRWQPAGAGVAEDIGDDGTLLVRTPTGIERLTSGLVSEIRDVDSGFW